MRKTAIVIGATGLTGNHLLRRLLDSEDYQKVKIFSRSSLGWKHPKLKEYVGDLLSLDAFKNDFIADEVFCCIGTTSKQTKDKVQYKSIDFGIPVAAAKLCKQNGIDNFFVISAMGANAQSKIFYNRTKGEMEDEVLKQKIPNTYILRPSLIVGKRIKKRIGEGVGALILAILNPFLIRKWKKYRAIHAETIAIALQNMAKSHVETQFISSDRIQEIALES